MHPALIGTIERRPHYYVLDKNREPVAISDALEWAFRSESADRIVRQDHVRGALVSTVFLGIDHAWSGPPLLFETMVFGDVDYDESQLRYSTWDEALAGHVIVLNHVREPAWSRWFTRLCKPLVGRLGDSIGGTRRAA